MDRARASDLAQIALQVCSSSAPPNLPTSTRPSTPPPALYGPFTVLSRNKFGGRAKLIGLFRTLPPPFLFIYFWPFFFFCFFLARVTAALHWSGSLLEPASASAAAEVIASYQFNYILRRCSAARRALIGCDGERWNTLSGLTRFCCTSFTVVTYSNM